MPNPFFFGGRITDPSRFVGRKTELREIFGALETAHTGQVQHVSVVGERRIGKSSLLYHICQTYSQRLQNPEKYRLIYADLDNAACHTQSGLLGFILKELNLPRGGPVTLERFQREVENLRQKQGVYIVLCLDEFEHLTQRKDEFPDRFFEAWRSLGSAGTLAFITASQTPLGELIRQGNFTSTFHNIFIHKTLGDFSEAEARQLLEKNTTRPFSADEQERLLALAGRRPARLQIAARLLYEAKSQPKVNWKKLKAAYQEQAARIEPIKEKKGWLATTGKAIFITFPTALGRFILDLLKNKDASDRTAAILGWLTLFLLIAVPLGWVNLEPLVTAWLSKGK